MPPRSVRRRFVLWLALVAMGLLVAAPTVSRTLAALTPTLDLGAWCTGHGLDRAHGVPSSPAHLVGGDACGYCVLGHQSPALASLPPPMLPPLSLAEARLALKRLTTVEASTPAPHSRGPPLA